MLNCNVRDVNVTFNTAYFDRPSIHGEMNNLMCYHVYSMYCTENVISWYQILELHNLMRHYHLPVILLKRTIAFCNFSNSREKKKKKRWRRYLLINLNLIFKANTIYFPTSCFLLSHLSSTTPSIFAQPKIIIIINKIK